MTDWVNSLQEFSTEVEFVLVGYTGQLDVEINKLLEDENKKCYEQFMVENILKYFLVGCCKMSAWGMGGHNNRTGTHFMVIYRLHQHKLDLLLSDI